MSIAGFHFIQHRSQEPRSGLSNRVAQSYCTAIDVEAGWIETQFADDGDCLNGKRFIEFDQLHFIQRPAGFPQNFPN